MEVSGQLHSLAALPWWKKPSTPLNRRLVGAKIDFNISDMRKTSCPCQALNPWSSSS